MIAQATLRWRSELLKPRIKQRVTAAGMKAQRAVSGVWRGNFKIDRVKSKVRRVTQAGNKINRTLAALSGGSKRLIAWVLQLETKIRPRQSITMPSRFRKLVLTSAE